MMEGEHFCVEIEIGYGKHSYSDFWFQWKEDKTIESAMKSGLITYFFKVSGEKKLVMIVKTDGDQIDDLLYNQIRVINKFADQIKIKVTAMYDYVTFANLANQLIASEKKYEEIQSSDKGTGAYHILDIKMEHRGISQKDFLDIWVKEIAAALEAKNLGIAIDIWKVLGERRVFCITHVDALPVLDNIILSLPMMKEMGDQMYITAKRLTKYNKFIEQGQNKQNYAWMI